MGSDLLVVSYYVQTSVGLAALAKCVNSNEVFVCDTSQSTCHGKNVTKRFVNSIHLVKYSIQNSGKNLNNRSGGGQE